MNAAATTVRVIRVFVSSPGDVQAERDALRELVDSINRTDGRDRGFRLELFRWEDDVTPQIGPNPQQVVDAQTPPYDIYLGILKHRFGTPTGRHGSGTEKEFRDALKHWKQSGWPWILFYFCHDPIDPANFDPEQYAKVDKFRKELGEKKKGLYAIYKGARGSGDSLYEKAGEHLRKIVAQLLAAQATPEPPPTEPAATRETAGKIKILKPIVPSEYTQWLLGRCGEVDLMGLELKHGLGVRLNHVYTPLATSARSDPESSMKAGRRGGPGDEADAKVQLLLESLDKQSLYVSGDPGSGKSTFCRWVTWLTCHREMPEVDVAAPEEYQETFPASLRGRLPMLVRLRDFWQHLPPQGVRSIGVSRLEQALQRWLADQKYPGIDWACVQGHLDAGTVLLMLDGVDEVPPVRRADGNEWYPREMLLSGLADAVARWTGAGNRVLVTSRPYGLNAEQQRKLALPHAPILGLDQPLQALLVRRWFVRLKDSPNFGLETAEKMIDHIHVERGLDDLANNPLLLTAMCIIYDQGKRLPHDKYLLYDRIVDTVLHKRYADKESLDPIRGRLAAIALGMHTGQELGQQRSTPEATASDSEVDAILQAYRESDGATDKGVSDTVRVREDLLSQSGLLVSRAEDKASFYHLSIQEFLAGERLHLQHIRKWDELVVTMTRRSASAGWRNTCSFLFGCLVAKTSRHVGVEFLQEFAKHLELPAVAANQRGEPGGVWNGAIVLGDCLEILSGREAAIPSDLAQFFRECVFGAIEQEIAIEDRAVLAVALGRLGDPRIDADLRIATHPEQHPGYVKIPAGEYKIGDNDKSEYSPYPAPPDEQTITIPSPFWLSKYPVTNSQYGQFVQDGGYRRREFWSDEGWKWVQDNQVAAPGLWRNVDFNSPNQPVVVVSWWEADAFCRWARGFLPTEQQWEAAARGPAGLVYPWGDDWESGICNSERKLGRTSAVGIFPRDKSPFGLYDMAGNVWEWCADEWEASVRVLRGGSWGLVSRLCRSAYRYAIEPAHRYGTTWASVWPQFRSVQFRQTANSSSGAWSGGRGATCAAQRSRSPLWRNGPWWTKWSRRSTAPMGKRAGFGWRRSAGKRTSRPGSARNLKPWSTNRRPNTTSTSASCPRASEPRPRSMAAGPRKSSRMP
jgi:formylglycine-generating enzyme required for sulfatase activity